MTWYDGTKAPNAAAVAPRPRWAAWSRRSRPAIGACAQVRRRGFVCWCRPAMRRATLARWWPGWGRGWRGWGGGGCLFSVARETPPRRGVGGGGAGGGRGAAGAPGRGGGRGGAGGGGAVGEGLAAAAARWTVVMDGDLQHPPERVPGLIAAAERGADLVVATRYAGAGSAGGLSSRLRGLASRGAGAAAKVLFPRALAGVSDPMSGFFAVRTAAVCPGDLRPRGVKILLEVLVRTPGLRVAEVPFTFAERHDGQSKASAREAARYLRQLAALRLAVAGRAGRLARFAVAGGSGVLVNLVTLAVLLQVTPGALAAGAGGQMIAAVAATQAAVGWNFALTERWVFPGRPGHWAARLLPFWALSCGALLAQLPLAARLQPVLGGSYVLATGVAPVILMLARFAVCDRV